jgi:hypothetical protein
MRNFSRHLLKPILGLLLCFLAAGAFGQGPAEKAAKPESNMKVMFDETAPGVVIVETGGERLRIDTATKQVVRLETSAPAADETTPAPVAQPQQAEEEFDEPGYEPYDYRLANIPTPKRYPKGSLTLYFTHRFTQPLKPANERVTYAELFGLDSFSASGFGLYYGVTDKFYVGAYRSPLCQRGLCRTIEIGAGYNFLHEKKGVAPLSLGAYASVEGNNNFRKEFTFNLQLLVARSVGPRVNVFFAPAAHLNSNGGRRFNPRAEDFFPPAQAARTLDLGKHTGSFGFGTNVRIRPTVSLFADYTPRAGFKQGSVTPVFDRNFNVVGFNPEAHASFGFGVQKDTARHTFSLTFSNTQGTTTSRYNSSNLVLPPKRFAIGFNLMRRLLK